MSNWAASHTKIDPTARPWSGQEGDLEIFDPRPPTAENCRQLLKDAANCRRKYRQLLKTAVNCWAKNVAPVPFLPAHSTGEPAKPPSTAEANTVNC